MRPIVLVLGGLIAILGAVWALQGAGILLGSFMSNDRTWLWIGSGTALLGVIMAGVGLRSRPSPKHQ